MTRKMNRSWLVQRLRNPVTRDNPFAFGGGLKNGGLSGDAMDILRNIFSFDYMGAAEFEFGALPEAMQRIARNNKNYTTDSVVIQANSVPPSWRDKRKNVDGETEVFIIADEDHMAEAKRRIVLWATSDEDWKGLKEPTRLGAVIRPVDDWDTETQGWLELDNGFFFFTNRDMFENTASLFGVFTK